MITGGKYSSGIPKLTARKRVGHQVHDGEQLVSARPTGQRRSGRASVRGEMTNRVVGDLATEGRMDRGQGGGGGGGFGGPPQRRERSSPFQNRQRFLRSDAPNLEYERELAKLNGFLSINHYAYNVDNQDDDGYDSDADLDPVMSPDDPDYMDLDNHEHVRKVGDNYVFDMDAQIVLTPEEEAATSRDSRFRRPMEAPGETNPMENTFEYEWYFRDVSNADNELLIKPSKPKSNAVLPMKPHGPAFEDWLEAAHDHPSQYMTMERINKHPDSKREPRPTFPHDRKLPDESFVDKYKGFLFVSGLVPHMDDATGEVQDFEDVMHQQSISEKVAKMFGVTSVDVSPATPTSAFVGFATKLEAKTAMLSCVSSLAVTHPVKIEKYEGKSDASDVEKAFVEAASGPESILKVTGLPVETTPVELLQSMFPPGTRLDAMFGPLTKEDSIRVSPTTILIHLASADLVSKALKSTNIANNAAVVGKRSAQVLRAKRERVFDGWTGPNRRFGKSKLSSRLFVTGDVPPEELFLSHHNVLHISGLPSTVTLTDLATFFQPFSADRRDIRGSGHIVRCSQGTPTGTAYIGFELPGEIDQVKELYNGKATICGADVTFRPVRDKLLRRGRREGARPERSLEELNDDLNNWERHVDPKDIEELEKLGVEKSILDEIMLTMRHHNRSFAAVDQAMPGERLHEQRRVGQHYQDVVRKYIKTLKECVATKEKPGMLYEAMFAPDQEVDMGVFDYEEERIKALRKKGM
jgi:hypothetical protein